MFCEEILLKNGRSPWLLDYRDFLEYPNCGKTREGSGYGMEDNTEGVKILAEASAIHSVSPEVTYRNHKSTRNTLQTNQKPQSPVSQVRCFKPSNCFNLCQRSPCVFHSTLKSICQPDKLKVPQEFQLMQSPGGHPSLPGYCCIPNSLKGSRGHIHARSSSGLLCPPPTPFAQSSCATLQESSGSWEEQSAFVPGLPGRMAAQASPACRGCHGVPSAASQAQDVPRSASHTPAATHGAQAAPAASSCALPQRDAGEPPSRQPLLAKKLPRGWKVLGGQKGKVSARGD